MLLPFACSRCKADKWLIRFNTEDKEHQIECAGCGHEEILEDIFKPKRKPNVKKAKPKTEVKAETKTEIQSDKTIPNTF